MIALKLNLTRKQPVNFNVRQYVTCSFIFDHKIQRVIIGLIISVLSVFCGSVLYAQSSLVSVRGVVTAGSEVAIGASIIEKNTQNGTVTDFNGEFSLDVPADAVLVVSYIGFKTEEIPVSDKTVFTIALEDDLQSLEEVVVIGYGTQKRTSLTGAVSVIPMKELESRPVASVIEALQGVVPGLIIQQSNSAPGVSPVINIRGINTMNNTDPLILIDGMIGDLQNVLLNDIESISVLKDAASTAIYGSRASNGVILVTTKKGPVDRNEVTYEYQFGVQQPTFLPNVVDSWIYAEKRNEALVNSGYPALFTAEDIAYYRNGGPNVKWIEELYKNNAPQQSHTLSLTGGNQKTTYLASMAYMDQESMFKGPDYGLKRYNARLNLVHQVSHYFNIQATVSYTRNDIRDHAYWTEWIVEQANRMPPIYPIKDKEGNYTFPSGSNANGLARLEEGGYRRSSNDDLSATVRAELTILEGLKLKGMLGGQLYNDRMHENRYAIDLPSSGDVRNRMTESFQRREEVTSHVTLGYDTKIQRHSFGLLIGFSYEGNRRNKFTTTRLTDTHDYDILVSEQKTDVTNSGYAEDSSIYSYFGRITYNYDEKYLFEANLRDDMSSKFAAGNRSALFPSFSAGWRISEENFYKPFREYVSSIKLRGSWGLTGNNDISNYEYMAAVLISPGYNFGNNLVNTAVFTAANSELRWETTGMLNVGLDVGFLDNALNLTFDFFNNTTYNILVDLPVPKIYGGDTPIQNAAKVRNRGWEFSANYYLKTGGVTHFLTGNISDTRNKVLDTKGSHWIKGSDVNTIIMEGYPINSYYSYRWDGFFQNEDEVAAGPHLSGITPKPGDIRYLDKNGDGMIKEDNDRFVNGDSLPHYTYSFKYGFTWRGFDFSMFWQGVGQRRLWLRGEGVEAFHNNQEGPLLDFHLDHWTPTHPNASYPRLTVGTESTNNATKSDFWIQDGSYLRLKNLQIGYTFPAKWVNKVAINQCRIYASGQNLFTKSQVKGGWDPEITDGNARIYPVSKVLSIGVNVKF